MSYINFHGPSIVDLVAQQQYEQRLASYRYQQNLAYRQKQEEILRQRASAEEQAYREAAKRAYIQEQLEAERAEYLRLQYEAQIEDQLREQFARREAIRQEALRQEAARAEIARLEAARLEAARQEAARIEAVREAARQEAARQKAVRKEAARQEAARQEAARQEAARQEAARKETLQKESSSGTAGQQKYKVVQAPFPYFGYYLVPLEEDAEMSESSDSESLSEEEKETSVAAPESSKVAAEYETECTTPEEQSDDETTKDNEIKEKQEMNDEEDEEEDVLAAKVVQSLSEALNEVEEESKAVETAPAADTVNDGNDVSSADAEAETISRLEKIQKEVESLIETYDRIFKSETSSGSESDVSFSTSVINSRIKVLQRGQLRSEELYSELDELSNVPKSYKKLKRNLTSRSVSYAEKIEDFLRVLEDHKVAARIEEEKEGKAIPVPPELKKLRRVTIEAVDDDSDF